MNQSKSTVAKNWDTLADINDQRRAGKSIRLLIGCGSTKRAGFFGLDIVDGPTVDIIAPAWVVPLPDNSVCEIVAEHLIEHLTYYQFQLAMEEWRRLLMSGGTLTLECPDLEAVCKQFATGNEYERYTTSQGTWALIKQLYGHQTGRSDEEQLSQVHKSGHTYEHLYQVLSGLRYTNITKQVPVKTKSGPCIRLQAIKI